MSNSFNKRVYGCAIIKSINSNYNADFSHQPRTLPDGTVYATDKTLKWSVRNYWKQVNNENVFYSKSLDEKMSPRTLDETYGLHFDKEDLKISDATKKRLKVLESLLSCIDVRLFGGTYAGATNISIHGTCQISHGVNRFPENVIYSEQIMSPFRNSGDSSSANTMTTLGSQSKLAEGHYVHHFSVNPKNIEADVERIKGNGLSEDDISKLKEALKKGVSFYDSSSKIGTDNECLVWVQLKADSKAIMPSFVDLIEVNKDKEIDFKALSAMLAKHEADIELIEIHYNESASKAINLPASAKIMAL